MGGGPFKSPPPFPLLTEADFGTEDSRGHSPQLCRIGEEGHRFSLVFLHHPIDTRLVKAKKSILPIVGTHSGVQGRGLCVER